MLRQRCLAPHSHVALGLHGCKRAGVGRAGLAQAIPVLQQGCSRGHVCVCAFHTDTTQSCALCRAQHTVVVCYGAHQAAAVTTHTAGGSSYSRLQSSTGPMVTGMRTAGNQQTWGQTCVCVGVHPIADAQTGRRWACGAETQPMHAKSLATRMATHSCTPRAPGGMCGLGSTGPLGAGCRRAPLATAWRPASASSGASTCGLPGSCTLKLSSTRIGSCLLPSVCAKADARNRARDRHHRPAHTTTVSGWALRFIAVGGPASCQC
jgi:hypothetical protein